MSNGAQYPARHVHEPGEMIITDGPTPPGFEPSPSGDYGWERERRMLPCPNLHEHWDLKGPCLLCDGEGVVTRDRYRYIYTLLYQFIRRGNTLP